jgi:hypothetical protein
VSAARTAIGAVRGLNLPTKVGVACAVGLFIAFLAGWLASWTPLEGTYARDYITLPKCGLAARFGTNMYTSSEDYMWFGPVGNGWLSHPALCVSAGIPLSYLPPLFGFKLLDVGYLLLHLGVIIAFGRRLTAPYRVRDIVVFVALGLFFPWYVMYHVGQYHAISVLALALVLFGPRRRVFGFVISAVTKPILAPAGLVLVTRGHFREAVKIVFWVAVISLPFVLLGYSNETGLRWGGDAFDQYLQIGQDQAKLFVPHWDQQISLAMLIDEWFPTWNNVNVRVGLTVALIALAVIGLRKAPMEVAMVVASLWFFTYYARGHEYHATVLVPVFAYLWTEPRGRYRNPWVALLCVSAALPTTWPIFIHALDLAGPGPDSFAFMEDKSPLLFNLFIAQKPLTAILLALTIAFTELRPRRAEAPAPVPATA